MVKKYSYYIEFLTRDVSPTGTKFYSATGECLQKAMRESFDDYLKKNKFSNKGNYKAGKILDAAGNYIADYHFSGNTIA